MVLSKTTAFLFTSHIIFFSAKVWFVYKLSILLSIVKSPKKEKFLLLFERMEISLYAISIMLLLNEAYYLFAFFNPIIPHKYPYIEMLGIIYIMIYIVNNIKNKDIE